VDPGCYFATRADAGSDAGLDVGSGGGAGSNGCGFASFSYPFFDGTEGFVLDTDNPAPGGNIAVIGGGAGASLSWDDTFGSPGHASLKVDATFTGYDQFLSISLNLASPIDATGKTVHAILESEPAPPDPPDGGHPEPFIALAQVEVESSDHVRSRGAPTEFALQGDLEDVKLPLFAGIPDCADPSRIIRLSVRLSSGAAQGDPTDGGIPFPASAHTTFHILSIRDGTGRPVPDQVDYTFDQNADCLVLDDGSLPTPGGFLPSLDGAGGVVLVDAPFTDYDQTIGVHVDLEPFVNLTGKTIYANVRLPFFNGTPPVGYFQVLATSGFGLAHAYGPTLATNSGQPMLNLASPSYADPGFDPSQISQIALTIGSGPAPDPGAVYPGFALGVYIYAVFAE
jgi:hypothetical protein